MKKTKIENEIPKIADKETSKIPLKGLFIVTFLSLLATTFIYWYENHKFEQKMNEMHQRAKEHPIKRNNKAAVEKRLELLDKIYFEPSDTLTKR